MAFYKVPSNIKIAILAFIRHLVSKKLYKAIEILLTPCCHPIVKSASAECDGLTTVITVQLANSINLYGSGVGTIFLWIPFINAFVGVKTVYQDSNTVVFEIDNIIAGTYEASIELYLPTSSDGLVGVSLSTDVFNIDVPPCGD